MADLPIIGFGTASNLVRSVITGTEPVLQVIASADDAKYVYTSDNTTNLATARFAVNGFPANLNNVDTLSIRLRYHWQTGTQQNTWNNITARIYKSDGVTPLTNAAIVASSITTTTATNSAVITFTGVDTAATAADWEGALLFLSLDVTKVKGGDTLEKRVTAGELTGTYTPTSTPRNVNCTTEVLALTENPATVTIPDHRVVACTTEVIHLFPYGAATETFYFDASQGIDDPTGIYTDDALAFDGSEVTGATSSVVSSTGLGLNGQGTTAPSTGGSISKVRFRVLGSTNAVGANVLWGGVTLTPIAAFSQAGFWGNYTTLDTPTGGWDWAKVNSLICNFYHGFHFLNTINKAEIEVTSVVLTKVNRSRTVVTSAEIALLTENPATIGAAQNRVVNCTPEAVLLTEQQATVEASVPRVVTCTPESILLTEQTANVNREKAIACSTEVVLLTEQSAAVNRSREVECSQESILLTEQPATISANVPRVVTCTTAVVLLTESPATVNTAREIQCLTEAALLTLGQGVVNASRVAGAQPEVVSLSSGGASVNAARDVAAGTESVLLTEQPAIITVGVNRVVNCSTEAIRVTEQPASVSTNVPRVVSCAIEAILLTEQQAAILTNVPREVSCLTEVVALVENLATIGTTTNRLVSGVTAAILLIGQSANVNRSKPIVCTTEVLDSVTNFAAVNRQRSVVTQPESVTLLETAATIAKSRAVSTVTEVIALTEAIAQIGRGVNRVVVCPPESLQVTENQIGISKSRGVGCVSETVTLTTLQAAVSVVRNVLCQVEQLGLVTGPASVSVTRGVDCTTNVINITEEQSNVNRKRGVLGVTEVLVITPSIGGISITRYVDGSTEQLSLVGVDATVSKTYFYDPASASGILNSLCNILAGVVFSPAVEIQWPGLPFTPPSTGMWLETRFFPNEPRDLVWDNDGQLVVTGFLSIGVCWRQVDGGLLSASRVADQIVSTFSKGTEVASTRVRKTPWQSTALYGPSHNTLPITVPYRGVVKVTGYGGPVVALNGSSTTEIIEGLLSRMTTLVTDPQLPVAWPGLQMTPPDTGMWLETFFVPSEPADLVWDNDTQQLTTGSLLVRVFYRPGYGDGQHSQLSASKVADELIELFPKGLTVGPVRIFKNGWQNAAVDLEGKSYIPVLFPYREIVAA